MSPFGLNYFYFYESCMPLVTDYIFPKRKKPEITRHEIAIYLNLSRFVISRLIKKMEGK